MTSGMIWAVLSHICMTVQRRRTRERPLTDCALSSGAGGNLSKNSRKHAWPNTSRRYAAEDSDWNSFVALIVNKVAVRTPNTPPTPLLLLKHGIFSPTDHCAELSPHPCDPPPTPPPPIGSFHSATMAARGCVIWGTKEPSQPPAPGTMDTPTDTFFSSPF